MISVGNVTDRTRNVTRDQQLFFPHWVELKRTQKMEPDQLHGIVDRLAKCSRFNPKTCETLTFPCFRMMLVK